MTIKFVAKLNIYHIKASKYTGFGGPINIHAPTSSNPGNTCHRLILTFGTRDACLKHSGGTLSSRGKRFDLRDG